MNRKHLLTSRALLFDLDGVLADSTASVEGHWRRWAEGHGIDTNGLMERVHGRRAIDSIGEMAPHLDAMAEYRALVQLEAGDVTEVTEAPGAVQFIASLPRESWGIVTSGVREVALARLHAANLPAPPLLIHADMLSRGKPDPEGYLLGARELGVSPAECVMFEDAPVGVAAGLAAGMQCIALTTTHSAESLGAAHFIVASLASLRVDAVRDASGMLQFEIYSIE
jgi:sugar-phosphatase